MSKSILAGVRRRQILRVLYEHGPLSLRALQEVVEPKMSIRSVQHTVKRLCDKNLVVRRFHTLPKNVGNYYQLSQSDEARQKNSKLLALCPDQLIQPHVRTPELLHSEACAVWSRYFTDLIPGVAVVRDFHFMKYPKIMEALHATTNDLELRPDLVLVIPTKPEKGNLFVAVEIERTRKTRNRLAWKIRKLALQSKLDGVIYVCDKNSIAEKIRIIYSSNFMQKAHTINNYGHHYFLFSSSGLSPSGFTPRFTNTESKLIYITNWLQVLATTPKEDRLDSQFCLHS